MASTRTLRLLLALSIFFNLSQYTFLTHVTKAEEAVSEPLRHLSNASGGPHGTSETRHTETSLHPNCHGMEPVEIHVAPADTGGHATATGHHAGEHEHQQTAMIFMFGALITGVAVMHLSSVFTKVQDTVLLFVLGMIGSFVMEGLHLNNHLGLFGDSHRMWMQINPHLVLFTLLPPLLAGDAMTIDTSVASRVACQCLYLAGPGVLVQALLAAFFLQWYMDWSFLLSLTTGSILCATDPVAVVGLLKELGASPVLTVQIQGESLLNDGTAIVLFLVAYRSLKGEHFGFDEYFRFLVQTVMMAWVLGMFIGFFFFSWIRLVNNRFSHSSSMIQITLTLCNCYCAFILAEGVLGISGVLATVSSSLVLAKYMWPHIISHESMEVVWHTFETLGNILIFFLAGSLTGKIMLDTWPMDYARLLGLYLFLLVLRAAFMLASRPLMKYLSQDRQPVTVAEAAVMTWGGLRGAVGLALAIQVYQEQAPHICTGKPQVSDREASRIFFFVGGIALLTTIINATTCPTLVNWLGITAVPEAQQQMLRMLATRLLDLAEQEKAPHRIVEHLKEAFLEMEHEIEGAGKSQSPSQQMDHDMSSRKSKLSPRRASNLLHSNQDEIEDSNVIVVQKLQEAKQAFLDLPEEDRKHVHINAHDMLEVDELMENLDPRGVNVNMAKVVNRTFLSLVSKGYEKGIEEGLLRASSPEANLLFASLRLSQSPLRADLSDYKIVSAEMNQKISSVGKKVLQWWKFHHKKDDDHHFKCGRAVHNFVHSSMFNLTMSMVIILNAIYLACDVVYRTEENANDVVWWVFDVGFQVIFVLECIMKLMDMSWHYFRDALNVFDFFIVILGFVGFALALFNSGDGAKSFGEAGTIRLMRLFRILRFARVFRLFHAWKSGRGHAVDELAIHVRKMTILDNYICAHVHAQRAFASFFGESGEINATEQPELARCMCQSQTFVYQAALNQVQERNSLNPAVQRQFDIELQEKLTFERLYSFVIEAMESGALTAREAESILHPLQHQLTHCQHRLHQLDEGIIADDDMSNDEGTQGECTALPPQPSPVVHVAAVHWPTS